MRGISIGFTPRDVGTIWPEPTRSAAPSLPVGASPFCSIFRPSFPLLAEYYWFATGYQTTPFNRMIFEKGGEERFDAAIIECGLSENQANLLHRPGTLPELAPYLTSDWVDLIALSEPEHQVTDDSHRLARAAYASDPTAWADYDRLVDEVSNLVFYCIDGFRRELPARDQETLALVEAPVKSFAGITLEWCELAERPTRLNQP